VGEGQIWGENNGGVGEDGERFGLIQRGEDNQNSQNRLFFSGKTRQDGCFCRNALQILRNHSTGSLRVRSVISLQVTHCLITRII
jgi:hypothetical protein